jgi:serine/threonine protein kinase
LERSDHPKTDLAVAVPSEEVPVTGESPAPATESVAGYRILGVLGEGGMGIVWEAEHLETNRRVALKVMRIEHAVDERHRRTFQREVQALARLEHPNIAALYDSGHTDEGRDYFSMEIVQGPTLDRWIAGRPPGVDADEVERRLRLFSTICDAVHSAHESGVIHRDLKPSNIVIGDPVSAANENPEGHTGLTPKILDFGLATVTDSDLRATTRPEVGIIKGTLQYMSPEQARCDGETIGVRSDVYALGVILYELLVGKRPYDVSQSALAEALRIICEQRPRPLRHHWVGPARLDADLVTVVGKALEKEVGRRYASVADLGDDIDRYLSSQPIAARPPSAAIRLRDLMAPALEPVVEGAAIATIAVGNAVVSTAQGISRAARSANLKDSSLGRMVNACRGFASREKQEKQ